MKLYSSIIIILERIISVDDPEAVGDQIKLALLHVGVLAFGVGMAFLANYLGELGVGWKTLLYISLFGSTGGNAALHLRTPQVSALVKQAQKQNAIAEQNAQAETGEYQ